MSSQEAWEIFARRNGTITLNDKEATVELNDSTVIKPYPNYSGVSIAMTIDQAVQEVVNQEES